MHPAQKSPIRRLPRQLITNTGRFSRSGWRSGRICRFGKLGQMTILHKHSTITGVQGKLPEAIQHYPAILQIPRLLTRLLLL